MKSHIKLFQGLLVAAVLAAAVARADDKSAASPAVVPPVAPPTDLPLAPAKSASNTDNLFPDTTIAKGKGFEIKRSQLDEAVAGIRSNLASRGQELMPSDLPKIQSAAFEFLVQTALLKQAATDDDKTKAQKLADDGYERIKTNAVDEASLAKQLKLMNMTVEALKKRLYEEALVSQVLRDKITPVTDEQAKKYYDDNPPKFEVPEMVRASHILVGVQRGMTEDEKAAKRKIAEDLLKRARSGEDFTKLVKEYSDDTGSKDKGGEYKFPRGVMAPEFEAAAFTLQTNQISDLVTTQYGYHIIKLSEKIPAHKLAYDEVKKKIKDYLEEQEMKDILPATVLQLRKENNVQVLDEELKSLDDAALESVKKPAASVLPK